MQKRRKQISRAKKATGKRTKILLATILVLSFFLRVYHAGDGIGGYHGWNEAYYSLKAQSVLEDPLKYPDSGGGNLFTSPPPLYDYVLGLVFYLFGKSVLVGRLLNICIALITVYLTYLLGC